MKFHRIITAISILLFPVVLCFHTFATGVSGTLDINCSTHVDGERFYIARDEFSLVKIADADVFMSEGKPCIRYTVLPKYKSMDCDWGNLTAEESHEKAKKLASMVTIEEYIASAITDTKGDASFYNLAPAMYLIVRTKVDSQNQSYYVDPFLVSVPLLFDETINYDVVARLKCGWTPEGANNEIENIIPPQPPNPDTTQSDSAKLPLTGQLRWPIPVLLVVGSIMMLVGWKKYKQQ